MAQGHMIMQHPKPFGGPDLDNSPLTSGNYPCKLKGDPATFYKDDLGNTIAIGETQQVSFKGSATHGGGSCQLAVTDDLQPSVSTSWKVIQSIEGGCPTKEGSDPSTYDFTIPDGIAPGKYVFAWTWVSKLAGQPEYYMNCAPLTVTGGKKRSANETGPTTGGNSFPELFVANLADINDCKTEPSTDVQYPDPGSNVKKYGTPKLAPVTGQNCVPKGAKSGGSSGSGSIAGGSKAGPAATPGSAAALPSTPAGATKALPTAFITSVVSGTGASPSTPTATPSSTVDVEPISTPSEPASSSSASSPKVVPSPTSATAPASTSTPAGGSSSAGALTGACTEEGTFNCIDGTSYQQCASGSWSVIMQMASTVKCAPGKSTTLFARDNSPLRRLKRRGFKME
ncbi:hypothetical protein GGR53DRAFT_524226 [Hypoxylon sp. FL1150]|nr:hypothetical protein GGR53DRAFT_524226 [Hypoxylon sp. FL1150]